MKVNQLKETKEILEAMRLVFSYNPITGEIHWINGRCTGARAGSITRLGYMQIKFNRCQYFFHRVAWALHNGIWPSCQIDHIDCNKLNNAISNLRLASVQQNSCNRMAIKGKLVVLKGVTIHKKTGKYQAQISFSGKRKYLGLFVSMEDAHIAYREAAVMYHAEFSNFGGTSA